MTISGHNCVGHQPVRRDHPRPARAIHGGAGGERAARQEVRQHLGRARPTGTFIFFVMAYLVMAYIVMARQEARPHLGRARPAGTTQVVLAPSSVGPK